MLMFGGKSSALCQCSDTLFIQSQGQCRWPRGAWGRVKEWGESWEVLEERTKSGRGKFCPSAHTEVTVLPLTLPLAILLWPITLASLSKCRVGQGEGGKKRDEAEQGEKWKLCGVSDDKGRPETGESVSRAVQKRNLVIHTHTKTTWPAGRGYLRRDKPHGK